MEQELETKNEPEEEIPATWEEMEMNELERQEAEDSGDGSESHGALELELKLSDGERERLERGIFIEQLFLKEKFSIICSLHLKQAK